MQNYNPRKTLEDIKANNVGFKKCLEKSYSFLFIKINTTKASEETSNSIAPTNSFLVLSKISMTEKSIFDSIDGPAKVADLTKEINEKYGDFKNKFEEYFDDIEEQNVLDDQTIDSFVIIGKVIKHRTKKLSSKLGKFKCEDSWNVSQIKEEYFSVFSEIFGDIIETIIRPIIAGLSKNNSYEKILTLFNEFLSTLGVYTYTEFKIDSSIDETTGDLLNPMESDDSWTTDTTKMGTLKEIISYPYVANMEENMRPILDGSVCYWRIGEANV